MVKTQKIVVQMVKKVLRTLSGAKKERFNCPEMRFDHSVLCFNCPEMRLD
jgi:hypothetical protein